MEKQGSSSTPDVLKRKRDCEPKIVDRNVFSSWRTRKFGRTTYYKCSTYKCYGTAIRIDGEEKLTLSHPHDDHCCHSNNNLAEETAMKEWIQQQLMENYYDLPHLYLKASEKFPKGAETLSFKALESSMKCWQSQYCPPKNKKEKTEEDEKTTV